MSGERRCPVQGCVRLECCWDCRGCAAHCECPEYQHEPPPEDICDFDDYGEET